MGYKKCSMRQCSLIGVYDHIMCKRCYSDAHKLAVSGYILRKWGSLEGSFDSDAGTLSAVVPSFFVYMAKDTSLTDIEKEACCAGLFVSNMGYESRSLLRGGSAK